MTAHTSLPLRSVVVGGGLAGLASAAYLARGGAHVTVFEKSATLGGRAITDRFAGFALNRGVHALYSGGPATSVLHELDARYSSGSPSHVLAREGGQLKPFPATALDLVRTDLLGAS